jgi:hypothetical protein
MQPKPADEPNLVSDSDGYKIQIEFWRAVRVDPKQIDVLLPYNLGKVCVKNRESHKKTFVSTESETITIEQRALQWQNKSTALYLEIRHSVFPVPPRPCNNVDTPLSTISRS